MYYTDMSHTRVLKHTFPRSGYMVAGGKLRLWHQPGEQLDSTGPTQKGARQPQWRYSQTLIILSTCSLAQSDPSAQAREGLASRLYLTRPRCKFFAAPIRLQKELKNVIKDILSNMSSHCSMGHMPISKLHLSRRLL